ncbi:MAG: aspartate/tyrosine/aromatic aminotransferase [Sphingomonadaceae bacterium]|nr:aspartate/tyrosine/aromatic aminotransferase [Sphingomonadaceae bacterium]MCP5382994.1 aspartate/tyrosine/aromatic aminotransferase [Altererythrobacter sp.]MCP5393177.1 aspartate/tyrosine/aromatic aminotransferase [Sphingomonadaceae bacterium]
MFSNLPEPPADPILGMAQLFAADTSPEKVDLGIGVYHDAEGLAGVLSSVKAAERWLLENQQSKKYYSSSGNAEFNDRTRAMLLGPDSAEFQRARTIQTPGGTGALKLAADYIWSLAPQARVFIPTPTWANHNAIFPRAGLELVRYPYYDPTSGQVLFDRMVEALGDLRAGDILLLHGCCHNPTGADLTLDQWREVAAIANRHGALPLIDMAYMGFGEGLEEDAAAVRLLASLVPEVMIASSNSKNFALYRERVGALTIIAADEGQAIRAHAHAVPQARSNWSMPPDHGAAVVAHILSTPELKTQWEGELAEMRDRVTGIRRALAEQLSSNSGRDFSFIAHQRGMFTQLDIGSDAVKVLRSRHHVHITGSGRMNVAGLTGGNVPMVARAISQALAA